MPDGETLLAVSDGAGELEFVRIPADGIGAPSALTDDGAVLRFEGVPSPDGGFIAYTDNNADLWLFEIATKSRRLVSTNREGVREQAWSPDGRYLAYVQAAANTYAQIHLYDVASGDRLTLTSDRVNSMSPHGVRTASGSTFSPIATSLPWWEALGGRDNRKRSSTSP